jgi:heat shock protein HslJ
VKRIVFDGNRLLFYRTDNFRSAVSQRTVVLTKRSLIILSLISLIIVLLTACGGSDPLDGTAWILTSYGNVTPLEGTTVTAEFHDGEISGVVGCNSYFSSYEVDRKQITFLVMRSSTADCLGPVGIMEQERAILRYISMAESFELKRDQLTITTTTGETLKFIPQ